MKLSVLETTLANLKQVHGDVEVYLQDDKLTCHAVFFVVPEEYRPGDGGCAVNIRTWPY